MTYQNEMKPRERSFVKYYEGDEAVAARRAGYKRIKVIGKRLMRRADIQQAISIKSDVLWKQARTSKSDTQRVDALVKLSNIFQLVDGPLQP